MFKIFVGKNENFYLAWLKNIVFTILSAIVTLVIGLGVISIAVKKHMEVQLFGAIFATAVIAALAFICKPTQR